MRGREEEQRIEFETLEHKSLLESSPKWTLLSFSLLRKTKRGGGKDIENNHEKGERNFEE